MANREREIEPREDFSLDDEGGPRGLVSKWEDRRVPLKDKLTQTIKGVGRGQRKDR